MRKILIISYFFPPCNVTGSFRIRSWAKYLNEHGYYPIIVTRHWDHDVPNYKKYSKSDEKPTVHEVNSNYEVYYTTYRPSLRDKIFSRYGTSKYRIFRRFLSAIEVVFQNYTNWVIPYRELYSQSKRVLKKEGDIKYLICSGSPFVLFRFGHKLSKLFNVPWIADYRDDWSTSQWYELPDQRDLHVQSGMIRSLEAGLEKKWLKTAVCFITISQFYVDRISSFIDRPGYVVMNGFDDEIEITSRKASHYVNSEFTIVYNGTLYYSQPIEGFLKVLVELIDKYKDQVKIMIHFPGLATDPGQVTRVHKSMKGFENNFTITERISREEVLDIQAGADLTLMISHNNVKGVTSSKLFDYIGLEKPIILYPGDSDILESIISELGNSKTCKTESDIRDYLDSSLQNHIDGRITNTGVSEEVKNRFSRKFQTMKLAQVLNQL